MKLLIEQIRKDRGMSIEQLSAETGISESHLKKIGAGYRNPNTLRLQQIATALKCEVRDLFPTDADINDIPDVIETGSQAPYLGDVNGGTPLMIDEPLEQVQQYKLGNSAYAPTMIKTPYHVKDGYVLRVVGESINQEILNGYYVLVDPNISDLASLDGKFIIIRQDGECCCKRYNHTLQLGEPCSDDPSYKPVNLKQPNTDIIGVVRQAFANWGI